ncbi:TPA: 50S ribosomal protein L2 [Patescibacteria group bacterium]|nr:50S ribosomal protein L2 [Patescibacteria group bacterium]
MPIRILKSNNAGRRSKISVIDRSGVVTANKPSKSLSHGMRRNSGRNSRGVITVQSRGGGSKRAWREVDLKQLKFGIPAVVKTIEYDPNRSAYIALVNYLDGAKVYILAPAGVQVGDKIVTNTNTKIKPGNRLLLKNIPAGIAIFNIELQPGRGGQIVRSAGTGATILGFDKGFAQVKLPSGEIRLIPENCFASVGVLSNHDHNNIRIGKAGRHRLMGRRPHVRGKAKNPVDHPHGGGEGNSPIGLKHPKTPTGKPTKGYKTRKKNKSNKHIIKARAKKKH